MTVIMVDVQAACYGALMLGVHGLLTAKLLQVNDLGLLGARYNHALSWLTLHWNHAWLHHTRLHWDHTWLLLHHHSRLLLDQLRLRWRIRDWVPIRSDQLSVGVIDRWHDLLLVIHGQHYGLHYGLADKRCGLLSALRKHFLVIDHIAETNFYY